SIPTPRIRSVFTSAPAMVRTAQVARASQPVVAKPSRQFLNPEPYLYLVPAFSDSLESLAGNLESDRHAFARPPHPRSSSPGDLFLWAQRNFDIQFTSVCPPCKMPSFVGV